MAAMSASLMWLCAGMRLLYVTPLTTISPSRPDRTVEATSAGDLPCSQSEPASGGKAPARPLPSGWWQAAQFCR